MGREGENVAQGALLGMGRGENVAQRALLGMRKEENVAQRALLGMGDGGMWQREPCWVWEIGRRIEG